MSCPQIEAKSTYLYIPYTHTHFLWSCSYVMFLDGRWCTAACGRGRSAILGRMAGGPRAYPQLPLTFIFGLFQGFQLGQHPPASPQSLD